MNITYVIVLVCFMQGCAAMDASDITVDKREAKKNTEKRSCAEKICDKWWECLCAPAQACMWWYVSKK